MADTFELHHNQRLIRLNQLSDQLVFPGSFNPLHIGHQKLAGIAERRLGKQAVFELSKSNVDKPALTEEEVKRRIAPLRDRSVAVTHAATFELKAALFPGSVFIIGFDTAVRLLDTAYYNDNMDELHASLQRIHDAKCRFFVGGRLSNGAFLTLDDLKIPTTWRTLFDGATEAEFREDVSSSQLRQG